MTNIIKELHELKQQVNDMSEATKSSTVIDNVSTALKEAGYQYVALILIIVSNLYGVLGWQEILAVCLALAVFMFAGWVKKIAESKINVLLKQSRDKDDEILELKSQVSDLKHIKAKLVEEIKLEVIKAMPPEKSEII